ncbi:hypothetical protein D3C81_881710 [compost metagenome]
MQPSQLFHNGLLRSQLHIAIDIQIKVMSFLRRSHFRNSAGHVPRVNRDALEPVSPTQFILILIFQAVKADILRIGVLQSWIVCLTRLQLVEIQAGGCPFEFLDIANGLNSKPINAIFRIGVVISDTFLDHVDPRIIRLMFHKISNFFIGQADLQTTRCKAST